MPMQWWWEFVLPVWWQQHGVLCYLCGGSCSGVSSWGAVQTACTARRLDHPDVSYRIERIVVKVRGKSDTSVESGINYFYYLGKNYDVNELANINSVYDQRCHYNPIYYFLQ